jgi:hypothetical protein
MGERKVRNNVVISCGKTVEFVDMSLLDEIEKEGFMQKLR